MNQRKDVRLDLMRLLGVLLIMVSHAGPPGWLFPIRYYGTPLLIVASALTFALIYAQRDIDVAAFYRKRMARLVLPAWLFLSFFFLAFYLAWEFQGDEFPFTRKQVIDSYTFYSGIGFMWVLKVYLVLALLTPLALKASKSTVSDTCYFVAIGAAYLLHELSLRVIAPLVPGRLAEFTNTVVFILVPYAALYLYGMRLARLSNRQVLLVALSALGVFLAMAYFKYLEAGHFVPSARYKYPPTTYYLSYALFALNLVYLLCRTLPEPGPTTRRVITWLSANSLWIYLWHIMAFYVWHFQLGSQPGSLGQFAVKFAYLLGLSILVTYLQVSAVNRFVPRRHPVGRRVAALLT